MTKPFAITKPGKYITRDGRTVEVKPSGWEAYPWECEAGDRWWTVSNEGSQIRYVTGAGDIIAKAPAPSTSKPRPAKGKKAKRRYVAPPLSTPAITRAQVSDLLAEALSFYEASSGAQKARALIAAADRELVLMRADAQVHPRPV